LVRLTPDLRNPIAEWDAVEVESVRHLKGFWISRGNPTVGPGGVLVFSAEDEEGNRDIYALETLSDRLHRLTTSAAVDEWPTVDPEGDRVVFSSQRSGAGDLYSVKLDGSGLTRLTDHPLRDWRPWIQGDSVLFVRGLGMGPEDGNMELVILDLADGSETQLTDNDWNDYEQMWSPDGRYLCWQSERLGHLESDIMVLDLVRGRRWNATGTPGRESDCRWTGAGNGLLYIRFVGEGSDVFLQNLWGGAPLNLTRYPGHESVVGYFRFPLEFHSHRVGDPGGTPLTPPSSRGTGSG
jgi:Tol biopolymer transport system component